LSGLALADGTAGATTSVVVSTTKNATFGMILVSGKTVYTLKASKTPCSAQCVKIWPELLLPKHVKHAKAGTGVKAAQLGTIRRSSGALQVTYSGKALYWFSGDNSAGQVLGNVTDTWGTWSVVVTATPKTASPSASNAPATPATAPPPTTPITSPRPAPPTTTPITSPTTTTTSPGTGGVSF